MKKGSILIVLGTGGVGKTTVAAALGLAAARSGLKTAVITVDPARRLRDALGLENLGGKPTGLGRQRLAAAGLDPSLKLSAMVLDAKGAWDGLVERFTTDPASRERILHNPFYRQLTEQFAGSEAYAALEQLYDLHSRGEFDLIVVDTPPAANAFEFLQAPAHLTRLLDSRMARWLFAPYLSAGRFAMRLASGAARFVVRELERFAGATVLSSISEFFTAAQQTIDGVVERFRKTEALLHSAAVNFVLVTTAEDERLRQARALIEEMRRGAAQPVRDHRQPLPGRGNPGASDRQLARDAAQPGGDRRPAQGDGTQPRPPSGSRRAGEISRGLPRAGSPRPGAHGALFTAPARRGAD